MLDDGKGYFTSEEKDFMGTMEKRIDLIVNRKLFLDG